MTVRSIHAQSRSAPLLKGCRRALRTVSTYLVVIATNQRRVISLLAPKICFVARLRTGLYLRPIFMAQEIRFVQSAAERLKADVNEYMARWPGPKRGFVEENLRRHRREYAPDEF